MKTPDQHVNVSFVCGVFRLIVARMTSCVVGDSRMIAV